MYYIAQVATNKQLTIFRNCFAVYLGFTTERRYKASSQFRRPFRQHDTVWRQNILHAGYGLCGPGLEGSCYCILSQIGY